MDSDFNSLRREMVNRQLKKMGIKNKRVLDSMNSVPRHLFVPDYCIDGAYKDSPLPIGCNQTISQPYIVALMIEAAKLKETDKVLEIGTGCGYSAAVLSNLVKEVYTIEVEDLLANDARNRLRDLGFDNVHTINGDGTLGYKSHAPYDCIIVTACAPNIPKALKDQLKINGKLIVPEQRGLFDEFLVRYTKISQDDFDEEILCSVRFVPLVGKGVK